MAKRKRRTPKKPAAQTSDTAVAEPEAPGEAASAALGEAAEIRFVGQWNRLVSTTNWEKGRIICQWREALMTAGAAVTEYSDEAWSQLVGGVTSQHVGRLRRVFQRFGDVFDQYEGLYWSHFQASLDWDDAEMWLEGGIQNGWSVSQMRGKRWETHGTPPEQQQAETALDREAASEPSESGESGESASADAESASNTKPLTAQTTEAKPTTESEPVTTDSRSASEPATVATAPASSKRTRLNVDVESLPDDLAEAFEQFKLAIIAHRREGWRDTTPESVVECLDALKALAIAAE